MKYGQIFAVGVFALGLAACQSSPEAGDQNPEKGFAGGEIGKDFNFTTTRSVGLEVAPPADFGDASGLAVQVSLPDGKVLYKGGAAPGKTLKLALAVPSKDQKLDIEVKNAAGQTRLTQATIEKGQAKASF